MVLLVLLTAAPALIAPYGQTSNGYAPNENIAAYVQVVGVATLALLALACVQRRARLWLPRSSVLLPLTLIVAWAALSIFWSVGRYDAVRAVLIWAAAWLAGVLVLLIAGSESAQRRLLLAIAAAAVPVAILALLQYLFGIDWIKQHAPPSGTLANKNMLGQYVALTMPVMFCFFLTAQRRAWFWISAGATACMAVTMVYTQSRAAWVVLILEALLAAGLLVWLRLKYRINPLRELEKKIALGCMLVLIAGLSALSPIGSSGEAAYSRYASRAAAVSGTFGSRYVIWRNSVPMWQEHVLFGVGIGNWQNWYEQYQSAYRQDQLILGTLSHTHAHNDYVEFVCQLGVVGLGLLLWMMVAAVLLFRRTLRSCESDSGPSSVVMLGPLIGLVGIGTSALVSFPFQQPIAILLIMVYLAILSLHDARVRELPAREVKLPAQPVRLGIAALLIVLTIGTGVRAYRMLTAEFYLRDTQAALLQERFEEGERQVRTALEFRPSHTLLKWFWGTSLAVSGRPEESVAAFDEVLAVRPYWESALSNKAIALANLGRHREAADTMAPLIGVRDTDSPRRKYAAYLIAGEYYEEALPATIALREWYLAEIAACAAESAAESSQCEQTQTAHQKEIDALDRTIDDLERRSAAAQSNS